MVCLGLLESLAIIRRFCNKGRNVRDDLTRDDIDIAVEIEDPAHTRERERERERESTLILLSDFFFLLFFSKRYVTGNLCVYSLGFGKKDF